MANQQQSLLIELEKIAEVKSQRDLEGTWFEGSDTYLQAMIEEVGEVRAEVASNKQCFLEDELGDLLWNFVCVLQHLELERKIDKQKVYQRAVQKYKERVTERKLGESWDDVKKRQKFELQKELSQKTSNPKSL
ncbi:MazG nucleotide pyrophosphohydrolase domain-containing protein [Vibrio alginolyticus]